MRIFFFWIYKIRKKSEKLYLYKLFLKQYNSTENFKFDFKFIAWRGQARVNAFKLTVNSYYFIYLIRFCLTYITAHYAKMR